MCNGPLFTETLAPSLSPVQPLLPSATILEHLQLHRLPLLLRLLLLLPQVLPEETPTQIHHQPQQLNPLPLVTVISNHECWLEGALLGVTKYVCYGFPITTDPESLGLMKAELLGTSVRLFFFIFSGVILKRALARKSVIYEGSRSNSLSFERSS